MFGIHDFALFLTTRLVLNLTPGTNSLYNIGHSAAQGRHAGIASALGISSGILFHIVFATLALTLITTGTLWCLVLLLGAAQVHRYFQARRTPLVILSNLATHSFVSLGIRLANKNCISFFTNPH